MSFFLLTYPKWDTELLIWLNGFHSSIFDQIMLSITHRFFWIPMYLILLLGIRSKYSRQGYIHWIIIIVLIIVSDQLTSSILKPFFERLRPCQVEGLATLLHIPGSCGGKYGFVSSHAANTFALATYVCFLFSNKWIRGGLIFWAFIVSYSRIYLGVHYPLDVVTGASIGAFLGILFYYVAGKKLHQLT